MSDRIALDGVTLNAPDALALARFYATITGGTATGDAVWAAAIGPDGVLAVQQDTSFRRPTWPGGDVPAQLHLEFLVDDLDATAARALAAGATRLDHQPNADHCVVLADPVGHPFCLTTWAAPRWGESVRPGPVSTE
jgi:catechol 2,3-dioxygenase-like lactoylglutathione lyase family enzyme